MNQDFLALFFQSAPFILALALGISVPLIAVLASVLAEKWSDSSKIAVILGALVVGNAISVMLTGRSLHSEQELLLNAQLGMDVEQGRAAWAGRFTAGTILFVSVGEIFRWVTGKRSMTTAAKQLWWAFLAFYMASYWVGVVFATSREMALSWTYAPVAFTALALMAPTGYKDAMVKVEGGLLVVLAASLVGAILVPDMTLQRGYSSWLPGFSIRLYGFAEHANSLGIIAALAVIMELSPFVRKRIKPIYLAVAVVALLLTQSKTSYMVALVGVAFVRYEDLRSRIEVKAPGKFVPALIVGSTSLISIGLIVFLAFANAGKLDRFLDFSQGITFTGRTRIWQITWNDFLANPIFGYGPAIWDLKYRYENNFMAAGQAHNQVFQTLGQAGLIGLATLLWYVYLMGRNCLNSWRATSGLAAIAFFGLLIRCFSESPMRLSGLNGMDAFVHLMAFIFAASAVVVAAERKTATPVAGLRNVTGY